MSDEFKQTLAPNGYVPRSWGDIVAIATLVAMLMATVAWGLKIESELNSVRERQMDIIEQVSHGVLPRADERLRTIERWIDRHEANGK